VKYSLNTLYYSTTTMESQNSIKSGDSSYLSLS